MNLRQLSEELNNFISNENDLNKLYEMLPIKNNTINWSLIMITDLGRNKKTILEKRKIAFMIQVLQERREILKQIRKVKK